MSETSDARECRLILISGPIASGKTTVAFGLAAEARRRGVRAAAVDVDEMVAVVAGTDWSLVEEGHRELSLELTAALVDRLLRAEFALVAVAGSTLSSHEWQQLLSHLTLQTRTLRVRLHVSLPESQRRAEGDPLRVATREPEAVARHYSRIDWDAPGEHDLLLDTDGCTAEQVVSALASEVLGPR